MFYQHKAYLKNKRYDSYIYHNGHYRKVLNWVWVDPVPLMVMNNPEHEHLNTVQKEGFYVSGGYLLDTASNIVVLVDNDGNILMDNNGNELTGYKKGE